MNHVLDHYTNFLKSQNINNYESLFNYLKVKTGYEVQRIESELISMHPLEDLMISVISLIFLERSFLGLSVSMFFIYLIKAS